MEENIPVCSICSQKYGSDIIPWRLSCGHSLCSVCMDEISVEEKACSKCVIWQSCASVSSLSCGTSSYPEKNSKYVVLNTTLIDSKKANGEEKQIVLRSETRHQFVVDNVISEDPGKSPLNVSPTSLARCQDTSPFCSPITEIQPFFPSKDTEISKVSEENAANVIDKNEQENLKCLSTEKSPEINPKMVNRSTTGTCEAIQSSTLSKGTMSNSYTAEDWRQRDIKHIDEKIVMLKEMQSQMSELVLHQKQSSQNQIGSKDLSKVSGCDFEAEEKIKEINDLVFSLESLKMEVQFTRLSSAISAVKKDIKLVESTVRQHIKDELQKNAIKNKADDIGATSSMANGLQVKYTPTMVEDSVTVNNESVIVPMRHLCITAMEEYETKSFEELRFEQFSNCIETRKFHKNSQGFGCNPFENKHSNYVSARIPNGKSSLAIASSKSERRIFPMMNSKENEIQSLEELRVQHYLKNGVANGQDPFLINKVYKGNSSKNLRARRMLRHRSKEMNKNNHQVPGIFKPTEYCNPFSKITKNMLTKYNSVSGIDTTYRDGFLSRVKTKFHVITAMEEYKDKSFEELRIIQNLI